jgi:AraC-like DNA-binding protein
MADIRIAASFTQLLYEYLDRQGLDAQQLLGPPPDPAEHFVAMTDWRRQLQRVDALESRAGLGLRLAEGISARHFGVVGYAALACNNLAEALRRMESYHASVYDVNPACVSPLSDGVAVEWGVERGRPGALVDETAIASLVQLARNMTGRYWPVRRVSFVNPPPADVQPYRDFFGGEVEFNAPATRLEFDAVYLALPLCKSDPALAELLEKQSAWVLQQVSKVSAVVDAWRRALVPLIRDGQISLAAFAKVNHTSPRTLQRRLADQGVSFQQLLDDTRRHLAEAHLVESRLDLAEIALLLGYSEQSAFTRAFRAWTGLPPAQWRKQHRLGTRGAIALRD